MPKVTLYLYQEQWVGITGEPPKIIPWHIKLEDEVSTSRIRIFIKEIDVEIPEVSFLEEAEVKQAMIAGFHKQKTALQAETQVKLEAIDNIIQQLLAITYTPEDTQDETK